MAIEDAGFEIRDTIMWLYGSGFPKSMDIEKTLNKKNGAEFESIKWKGWGTCLKPAFEPIIVARKPFKGTLVDNIIKYGVGGLNIDECRVRMREQDKEEYYKKRKSFENTNKKMNIYGGNSFNSSSTTFYDTDTLIQNTLNNGRFPANLILTYNQLTFDDVCGGFPNTKPAGNKIGKDINKNLDYNASSYKLSNNKCPKIPGDNGGSASRYFYCAKASKKDRDEGLDNFEEDKVNDGRLTPIDNPFQRGETPRRNIHPTVKPTELMQYLIRLVTPNGGVILDPFMGSGSTGKAVMFENKERNANYRFIGIELDSQYCDIANARITHAKSLW